MINHRLAAGLSRNLSVAYMYQGNFEQAMYHAEEFERLKKVANLPTHYVNGEIQNFIDKIPPRIVGFEANAHLAIPEKMESALDFAKIIGRRNRNKNLSFISISNKANQFYIEYEAYEAGMNPVEEIAEEAPLSLAQQSDQQIDSKGANKAFLQLYFMFNPELRSKAMPEEVAGLSEIYELIAFDMNFTSIPENIGNLKNLRVLNLSGNQLSAIPESIGTLENREVLNLNKNALKELPASLKNCTKLKRVSLKKNNFSKQEMDKIYSCLPAECKIKF